MKKTVKNEVLSKENCKKTNVFLQNKPNFPHFSTENACLAKKQTQFKANFGPISRVAKPIQTQFQMLPYKNGGTIEVIDLDSKIDDYGKIFT